MKKTLPSSKPIRVIVADDHPVVREGLAALIAAQPDMELIGEAQSGRAALRDYQDLCPDVILLDVRMPEMDGIEATRAIVKQDPKAKVIALSTYQGEEDVYQALKAGAKAYLLKDSSRREILECIRSVHQGQISLSRSIATKLAAGLTGKRLTARETEIIEQLASGKSNKEIAGHFEIAESTIKVHLGHIFAKLGANGRTEAIRIALERGLIRLPQA